MTNRPIRTYLTIEPIDGHWRAFEPRSDGDTVGVGITPPKALIAYAEQVEAQHE